MAAGDRADRLEGRLSARFSASDKVALDETIRRAERLSRVEFSVFVGHAEGDPRDYALSLHGTLVAPSRSILVLVDPGVRALEVITGSEVRRTLRDQQVELAVVAMQSLFATGDLVGGLRRGIQMLAEHARPPSRSTPSSRDQIMTAGLVIAAVVALLALVLIAFFRSQARELVRAAQADTARLQAVLEDVKSVAWDNRDVAPDLSTIVIDTIRTGEERIERRQLPK